MKTKKQLIKDFNLGLIEERGYIEGIYHCKARVVELTNDYVFGYVQFSGEPLEFFKVKLYDEGAQIPYFYLWKQKFTLNEVARLRF